MLLCLFSPLLNIFKTLKLEDIIVTLNYMVYNQKGKLNPVETEERKQELEQKEKKKCNI